MEIDHDANYSHYCTRGNRWRWKINADKPMADGIRTALAQLDEMQSELKLADNDFYTPILVVLTDGTPTDDPRKEFDEVRRRVHNHELFVFPLGIGEAADMARLRDLFPIGEVPLGFSKRYKMIQPNDYTTIFEEIRNHVQRKQKVMVSEGDSLQSSPAVDNIKVNNNQMGESCIYQFLASLA